MLKLVLDQIEKHLIQPSDYCLCHISHKLDLLRLYLVKKVKGVKNYYGYSTS